MLQKINTYTGNSLDCGWISPTGHIIQCEYYQHIHVASQWAKEHNILVAGDHFFEAHGWLKISRYSNPMKFNGGWVMVLYTLSDITKKQIQGVKEFIKTFPHYKGVSFDGRVLDVESIDELLEDELYDKM